MTLPRQALRRCATACGLVFALTSTLAAPTLWPTRDQWQALKQRLKSDHEAQQVVAAQKRLADRALDDAPQPVASITTAGRLQGDALKTQTEAALRDMDRIQALAVCYMLSGDARYASRAGTFLAAWAAVNHPSGRPIDETALEPAIFGYRLVRDELAPASRAQIDGWLLAVARAEMASRDLSRATATNNWHSHRLKTVGLIGYVLKDAGLIAYAKAGLRRQIDDNLLPSGESIDFQERDALSYHVYDLRPMVTLALAIAEDGDDLYHWRADNGASIARSVDWLMPYVDGEKKHAEFVGSRVPFDKARSDNHERGHEVGAPYDPKNAIALLDLVAAYDPRAAQEAAQLSAGSMHLRMMLGTVAAPGP